MTKKKVHCFVCGKSVHYASQYRDKAEQMRFNKNPSKANMAEREGENTIAAVFVSMVNLVDGTKDWVIMMRTIKRILLKQCGDYSSKFRIKLILIELELMCKLCTIGKIIKLTFQCNLQS